jgi:hypothetical protein
MRVLHKLRCCASYFNFQYPPVSLRPYSNSLHLLPCLSVTFIPPSTFPSIMRFRRQFLRKIWPIQLAFPTFNVCEIFLSSVTQCSSYFLISHKIFPAYPHFSPAPHSKLFIFCLCTFRNVQISAPYNAMLQVQHLTCFFYTIKSNLLIKRVWVFFCNL